MKKRNCFFINIKITFQIEMTNDIKNVSSLMIKSRIKITNMLYLCR